MPLPPGLQSPREVTHYYNTVYEELVRSGKAVPFVYPWAGVGAFVVLGYLVIDHRKSPFRRWLRFPVFSFLFAFQAWCVATNKAKHPAAALGIGLLSAWGVIWSAALIIFHDFQTEFRRIERQEKDMGNGANEHSNGTVQHACHVKPGRGRVATVAGSSDAAHWQSYPDTLGARLIWAADLFCAFRGVGWNMQMSGVPLVPKRIEAQLRGAVDSDFASTAVGPDVVTISKTGIRRFDDRKALIVDTLWRIVIGYIVTDIVKTLMHHDPFFWGYTDAPAPAHLPQIMRDSFVLLRSYRLLLALTGIYTVLWITFKLGPLFFCVVLGPRWLGTQGEAWMNPADMFGSFKCVLDRGLAGWWAGFWHQVFRYGFQAPAERLLQKLAISKYTVQGRLIELFVAFFMSGCLHACGSYTQLGDTRPLRGPLRFFMLQALGIALQLGVTHRLYAISVIRQTPRWIEQTANLCYVVVWLYFTAPLLVDDFAQGGAWLFEPIAISPLRAMGLGAKDDTWWCWYGGLLFWRQGEHFWQTGIAA